MAEAVEPTDVETNTEVVNINLGIHDSDEVLERYCEPCQNEGMTKKATSFCYTCLDYNCCTCSKYHNRYLPDHQPVNVDDITHDLSLKHCSVHNTRIIKFYCSSCNSLLCCDCKLKTHQRKNTCVIKHLIKYVDELDVEAELNEIVSDTQNVFKKLSETAETTTKEQENLVDPIFRITKETEVIYAKFVQELHALEEKLFVENESRSERMRALQERMELIKSKVNKTSASLEQLALSAKYQKCKIFMDLRHIKLESAILDTAIDDIGKECTPEPDLVRTVLKQELNDMIENMETVLINYDQGSRREIERVSRKVATPIADINVKASSDTEDCDIMDFCILDQQYIVACDRNNCSVKLVDLESRSVVYSRPVETHPEAVAKINDSVIALARRITLEEDDGIIEFLTLTQSRTLVSHIKKAIQTEIYCTNIIFYESSLIVSMHQNNDKGKIQKLSLTGSVLCSLEADKLFCFPDYLAIDPFRNLLYVSDFSGTIAQTECDNMKMSQVMHASKPQGITVDEDGLVFLCEMEERRVRAFDFDSKSTYNLIESDSPTWNPLSVCINNLDRKLYVGQYNSNYMKVYKIEKKEFVRCEVLEKIEKWIPV